MAFTHNKKVDIWSFIKVQARIQIRNTAQSHNVGAADPDPEQFLTLCESH
jgi:hypothetical protein